MLCGSAKRRQFTAKDSCDMHFGFFSTAVLFALAWFLCEIETMMPDKFT